MGETEGVTRRSDRRITEVEKYAPQWGWARVTGGGGSHASNLPIFFMVLKWCFTECFTRRLAIGRPTAYRWGTPTACPMVNRRAKRSPDSRGYCQGYGEGGKRGVNQSVIYGFTPAGLQSHCTVQISIRQ